MACVPNPGYYYGNWPVAPISDQYVAVSFGACCALCTNRTDCISFTYWPIFAPGKPDCTLFTNIVNQLVPSAAAQSYTSTRPSPAAPR